MKKIITLIFVLVMINITSFGQEWHSTLFESDELAGTEAYTSYVFDNPNVGSFIYWTNKEGQFRIVSHNHIFNYESGYGRYSGHYCGFVIKVGLYDEDEKLIEKFEMWLDCPASDGKPTYGETREFNKPLGQTKKCKKIFNHLKTNGYVRILADLYGGGNFDLKITHHNIEESEDL